MTGGRGSRVICRWALVWVAVPLIWLWAAPARAADQFTIDSGPDSFGPIVTDAAGNGYVAWEHTVGGAAADVPMFCKLAPGAKRCAHPINLALPGAGAGLEANALAPFPILGPGNTIWVVASRYVIDDVVVWTSSDGGRTFGGPLLIPNIPNCPSPCPFVASIPYTGLGTVDDALPVASTGATYDRQLYRNADGSPFVYWFQSSYNPDLGFNFDAVDEIAGGPPGVSEFTFSNPGSGGVAGSALGTTSVGEVVEAYWLITTPPTLAFYSFNAGQRVPISPQNGWSGPTVVGDGYLPRMADGAGGLFLLSADAAHVGAQPTLVQVHKYSTTAHAFGAATTIATAPADTANLYSGGGLAENYDTGQLAAVWPRFAPTPQLDLYLSNDGVHFSPPQYIATVGDAYAIDDNARIAIADNGTGFVTFRDARGLQVADLDPLGAQYATLHSNGEVVNVAFACPAPTGRCEVTATLTRGRAGKVAQGRFTIAAAASRDLKLKLSPNAIALLRSHHGRLSANLKLTVRSRRAILHTTTAHVTIRAQHV